MRIPRGQDYAAQFDPHDDMAPVAAAHRGGYRFPTIALAAGPRAGGNAGAPGLRRAPADAVDLAVARGQFRALAGGAGSRGGADAAGTPHRPGSDIRVRSGTRPDSGRRAGPPRRGDGAAFRSVRREGFHLCHVFLIAAAPAADAPRPQPLRDTLP